MHFLGSFIYITQYMLSLDTDANSSFYPLISEAYVFINPNWRFKFRKLGHTILPTMSFTLEHSLTHTCNLNAQVSVS